MLGGKLSRRYPSDRSVWSHLVVVLAPDGDDLAGEVIGDGQALDASAIGQ